MITKSKLMLLAMIVLFATAMVAQEVTGNIRGLVQDPSGAVVGGANVQIVNTDRGEVVRTITTGSDGNYVASYVPVGHYKIIVSHSGFKTFTADNIVLNVSEHRTVDIPLSLGTAQETVTVQESPVELDLQTNTAAGLINGTQIRELAINTRNFAQLVALQPGVSTDLASDQLFMGPVNPVTGTSNQMNFAVNGNRATQNNWTIDGSDNFDRGANLTLISYPSIDSIAEFKVLRSNYLPEHGRSSGGEINVITRSGSNSFHGSVYEFVRNDLFNANNYFNNLANIPRPPLRWNDFGFTVGGPIKKSRTFFFYSQEWRKIITYNTRLSTQLPTQAELQGNFPRAVCTAFNAAGTCTAQGTTIAAINPVAQAYIKDIFSKIPPLTDQAKQTLTFVAPNRFDYREENVRIDHTFSSKFSIFGRYLDDSIPTQESTGLFQSGFNVPGLASTTSNSPGRNLAIHATNTLTNNLVNDAGYAFTWGGIISDVTGSINKSASPDINPKLPFSTGVGLVPALDFSAQANVGTGQAIGGFGPYRDYNKNHNFFDNLTWVRGHHSLKFGGSYNYYTKDENPNGGAPPPGSGTGANGTFFFSDAAPGAAANNTYEQLWANFLLGNVNKFSQTNVDFRALIHQQQMEFYGQDEWRMRPNLTLSYGLRYSLFRTPTYGNGELSTFDPQLFDPAKAPALTAAGTFPAGFDAQTYTNGIIVGGQNSPFGQSVESTPKANFAPRLGFAWDPYGHGTTSIRGGYGIFYDSPAVNSVEQFVTNNPPVVQALTINKPTFADATAGLATTSPFPVSVGGPNPNWSQPYSQMFDLDVQHQITQTMMFDIGYYGNLGRHLVGVTDVNMPQPGAFVNAGIAAPFNGNFTNLEKLNLVRPFKGYDAINLFSTVFTSNYHGLQAQFQKQFTGNSLVVLNYTWSKNLTTASSDFRAPQNTNNILGDYGPADIDRRHIFTGSYVYTLPFFRGQQGLVGHVLGGWELSGIVYLNSGKHFTASATSSSNDKGGLGLASSTFSGARPDQIGDPNTGLRNITQWWNTSAFAFVSAGQIRPGSEKRGALVGPGVERWDANLYKNAKLTERFTLQLRAEGYNVLNHTNFTTFQSTRFGSSLFGLVGSARDARQLQLAMKLLF